MRKEYYELYNIMASSNNVDYMHVFGQVQKEVMEWAITYKPELAQEWIEKLESIRWKNYLTMKESEAIISKMDPSAPWTREQWRQMMIQNGLEMSMEPYFNSCALCVTMCMIMSDSGETLKEYVDENKLFKMVYKLAVDKLTDKDGQFSIRRYFRL